MVNNYYSQLAFTIGADIIRPPTGYAEHRIPETVNKAIPIAIV